MSTLTQNENRTCLHATGGCCMPRCLFIFVYVRVHCACLPVFLDLSQVTGLMLVLPTRYVFHRVNTTHQRIFANRAYLTNGL